VSVDKARSWRAQFCAVPRANAAVTNHEKLAPVGSLLFLGVEVTVYNEPACPAAPLRHAWISVGK
jgi:hypothetical protein